MSTPFEKAFKQGARWDATSFPEFPAAVYWLRQILALVVGLVWGLVPLTGWVGLLAFGATSQIVCMLYYTKYLDVDVEDFGRWDLMKEGFMASFGCFLLVWVVTFSVVHPSHEFIESL